MFPEIFFVNRAPG